MAPAERGGAGLRPAVLAALYRQPFASLLSIINIGSENLESKKESKN
jgi:hypothetical protein